MRYKFLLAGVCLAFAASSAFAQTGEPPAQLSKDMDAYVDSFKTEMDVGGKAYYDADNGKSAAANCPLAKTALDNYTKARDGTVAMIAELKSYGDEADAKSLAESLPDANDLVASSQKLVDKNCSK